MSKKKSVTEFENEPNEVEAENAPFKGDVRIVNAAGTVVSAIKSECALSEKSAEDALVEIGKVRDRIRGYSEDNPTHGPGLKPVDPQYARKLSVQ